MCGRFEMHHQADELIERFQLAEIKDQYHGNYNIAPSQQSPVITMQDTHRVFETMKWGFIPSWSKDAKIGYEMINARSEGIETKPSFRSAINQRRCLIPVDGFYEWRKEGNKTIPYHISINSENTFALAGLWEEWHDPDSRKPIRSFSIITTAANKQMSEIHHRMPAILEPDVESSWLATSTPLSEALDLLKPYCGDLKIYPVSSAINTAKGQGKELTRECELNTKEAQAQGSLF